MKQRILTLLLVGALSLSLLTACGGGDDAGAGSSADPGGVTSAAPGGTTSDSPGAVTSDSPETSQPAVTPGGEEENKPAADSGSSPSNSGSSPSQPPASTPSPEPTPEPTPEPSAPSAGSVDLSAFYHETYDALFPVDADGNPTGPFTENFAAVPEMLEGFYPGLSAIETKQCMVLMPMMTGVPYEVVLIEVANSADVEAVKAILQARIDGQIANQMNYPAVIENWELNSRIVTNGNYIMMAVCEVCDDFVAAFDAQF